MVKNPLYAPLLNHRAANLSETTEKDDLARIKVVVVGADGKEAAFVWILARTSAPDCARCWMTSTVMRVEHKSSPFKIARTGPQRRTAGLVASAGRPFLTVRGL